MSNFVARHRRKILVTSAVTVLTVLATTGVGVYVVNRWIKQQTLKLQQQKFAREQIKRKFEQTQRDAQYTVYELVPVIGLVLNNKLDLDGIVGHLKMHGTGNTPVVGKEEGSEGRDSSPGPTKTELWNELKLKSITKMCCTMYTLSLLVLLTRVQLNVLSKREYTLNNLKEKMEREKREEYRSQSYVEWIGSWASSVLQGSGDARNGNKEMEGDFPARNDITEEEIHYCNEQAFLSISWWLLNRGYVKYYKIIESEVFERFNDLQPNDQLSIEDFSLGVSQVLYNTNQKVLSSSSSSSSASGTNELLSILYPDSKELENYTLDQSLDSQVSHILTTQEHKNKQEFDSLVDELKKILTSTAIAIVVENLINESYKYCMNQIELKCQRKTQKKIKRTTTLIDGTNSIKDDDDGDDGDAFSQYKVALLTVSCKDLINTDLLSSTSNNSQGLVSLIDSLPELDELCASIYQTIV